MPKWVQTDMVRLHRFEDLILVLPLEFHLGSETLGRNHSEDDISFKYVWTNFPVPREAEIEVTAYE